MVLGQLSSLAQAISAGDLLVSEIFGPTLQGEGPGTGTPATFVRLSECNLHCVWCDTPYTWDWSTYERPVEQTIRSVSSVAREVKRRGARLLVISGGEPMMQKAAVAALCGVVRRGNPGLVIEVETNGTLAPDGDRGRWPDRFNVSIKLTSNGADSQKVRLRPRSITALRDTDRAVWKFVIGSHQERDVREVEAIVRDFDLPPDKVWLMPEGTYPGKLMAGAQRLAPVCISHGWHLSGRLQIMLWGSERAR